MIIPGVVDVGDDCGDDTELTVVTADLVTVPAELVALIVYTVDVAGDTSLVPATATTPIPWSMLTESAPVTFHNRVDVPPALILAGLLLNAPITAGCPTSGVLSATGVVNVIQPGKRISNNNSDRERKPNLFNLCTS
jgi:hypothetical protein